MIFLVMRRDDTYDYVCLVGTEDKVTLCSVAMCFHFVSQIKTGVFVPRGTFLLHCPGTSPASALDNDLNLGCPEGLRKQMSTAWKKLAAVKQLKFKNVTLKINRPSVLRCNLLRNWFKTLSWNVKLAMWNTHQWVGVPKISTHNSKENTAIGSLLGLCHSVKEHYVGSVEPVDEAGKPVTKKRGANPLKTTAGSRTVMETYLATERE